MLFQIVCGSDNPYIHLLKQRRLYAEKADTAYVFFRKIQSRDDDFPSKAYTSLERWITEKSNPKLFKQYLKLELRDKCSCESVFCLSGDIRDVIVSMSENLRYMGFAYSEDFGDLPEVGIGRGVSSDALFFCADFEQKHILNKQTKRYLYTFYPSDCYFLPLPHAGENAWRSVCPSGAGYRFAGLFQVL